MARELPLLITISILGNLPHHTVVAPHSLVAAGSAESGHHVVNVLGAVCFVCEHHRDDFPCAAKEGTHEIEERKSFGVPSAIFSKILSVGKVFLLQKVEVVLGEGKGHVPHVFFELMCDRVPKILELGCDRGRRVDIFLVVDVHSFEGYGVHVELPRHHEVHVELQERASLGGR